MINSGVAAGSALNDVQICLLDTQKLSSPSMGIFVFRGRGAEGPFQIHSKGLYKHPNDSRIFDFSDSITSNIAWFVLERSETSSIIIPDTIWIS